MLRNYEQNLQELWDIMSNGFGVWEEDRHGEEGRCAQGSIGVGEEHGQ